MSVVKGSHLPKQAPGLLGEFIHSGAGVPSLSGMFLEKGPLGCEVDGRPLLLSQDDISHLDMIEGDIRWERSRRLATGVFLMSR